MRKFVKTPASLKSPLVPGERQHPAETTHPDFSSSFLNGLEIGNTHTSLPSTSFSYDFSKIPLSSPSQTDIQPSSSPIPSHEPGQTEISPTSSPIQAKISTSGSPLDANTRAYMEPRFQHDFSKIRIHTDAEAARRVNATAYTIGHDIVFDSGQYQPETDTGKRLLAHELAHTIQQSRGGATTPPPIPTHPLEQAAQQAASIIAQGGTASVAGASAPGIARQPRSLSENLNPSTMSDADLQQEITLIRQWLTDNPGSSSDGDQLTSALSALETEMANRNGQPNQPPTDQGQVPADTSTYSSTAPSLAAAGMLTPGVPPLSPTTPGTIPDGAFNNWPKIPGETPLQDPTTGLPEVVEEAEEGALGTEEAIGTATETGEAIAAATETGEVVGGLIVGESMIPVVGWIALGVTVLAVGGYLGYKYLLSKDGKVVRPLTPEEESRVSANPNQPPAQLPGQDGQNPVPAVDPNTGEPLYTPGDGDYTPAIDPVTGEPLLAPGPDNQSNETMEATGESITSGVIPKVKIFDKSGSLGEFDQVDLDNQVFIEDKSAVNLSKVNPRTGLPAQTSQEWAEKNIYQKTVVRINNLLNKATGTMPEEGGTRPVPALSQIKGIRTLKFVIQEKSVQADVADAIQRLQTKYPDWTFLVEYP